MPRFLISCHAFLMRQGLIRVLSDRYDEKNLCEAVDENDAVEKLVQSQGQFDIIISDVLTCVNEHTCLSTFAKKNYPAIPVLIVSSYPDERYALSSIRAGIDGFLDRETSAEELLKAVERLLLGRKYIAPCISEQMMRWLTSEQEEPPHNVLSNREFEVLCLIAAGKSVKDIASLLSVSISTVSTYRCRIMEKLNVKSSVEIIRYGIKHNLV